MGAKRENPMLKCSKLNLTWMLLGILLVGGIYCLSHNNVDQVVVSESKTFMEFVRTVLK